MKLSFLQAFVSEYAVTGNDAGKGSFLAALGEAGFLIGLEKNRCVVAFNNLLSNPYLDIRVLPYYS